MARGLNSQPGEPDSRLMQHGQSRTTDEVLRKAVEWMRRRAHGRLSCHCSSGFLRNVWHLSGR
jgi:hypothetical protein